MKAVTPISVDVGASYYWYMTLGLQRRQNMESTWGSVEISSWLLST